MYTLQYFRHLFATVNNWCIGTTDDDDNNHCAVGHLGGYSCQRTDDLRDLTDSYIYSKIQKYNDSARIGMRLYPNDLHGVVPAIAMVNDDSYEWVFKGETPQERVLNVIDELIAIDKAKANKELMTRVEIIASSNALSDMIEEAEYELV